MQVVLFVLSCLSLLIWCVLLFFRGGFWRARPAAPLATAPRDAWPAVAAVVPARNEADVIAQAVGTLLAQEYPGPFHVIVVDDHSTDGTADAARAAALQLQCPDRLTVLTAKPLPPGWSGKVWAQSQGIEAVRTLGLPADFLLLTDADIGHPTDAVAQLVARADAESATWSR